LGSDPAVPSSAVQGRPSALAHANTLRQNGTACGTTLTYTPKRNGWYGLLIFDPGYASVVVDATT
jgi:hypothetical protein